MPDPMTTPWTSRCDSGSCIETRTVTVEGVEYVEVRDTETDGTLLVTAKAWAQYEAALRAEVLKSVARILLAGHVPEVTGPRTWALPEIPADVTAVRDSQGYVWRRESAKKWRRSTGAWTDNVYRLIGEYNLGPLTEVRDEAKGASDA